MTFAGFPEESANFIRIPDQFFRNLLPDIDDLDELRVTLFIIWRLEHMEGLFRYLRLSDLAKDSHLVQAIGPGPRKAKRNLEQALQKASARGSILMGEIPSKRSKDTLIFLNSPRGRAALDSIRRGDWRAVEQPNANIEITGERPNIFQLYEANIGALTPLIADALRDAEKTYPARWVEDAFRIALERNKRSWHYIEAILHRWQEGGRDDRKEGQDRRDSEKAGRGYSDWEK
jgi:DnaD/phage-associated family protein